MTDMITLPRATYDAMVTELEDLRDIHAARAAEARVAAGESELLPIEMAQLLWDGANPVRVWREYRKLTGKRLAELSNVPQSYISEIETGKKPGSVDALAKLAHALQVKIDDLVMSV